MTEVLWVSRDLAEEIIYLCVSEILCCVRSVQEVASSVERQQIRVKGGNLWAVGTSLTVCLKK